MTFPQVADFTSPSPADAWWLFNGRLYATNGAGLLATVRQLLGLPATAVDLKWDGALLAALNDRARVLAARDPSGQSAMVVRSLPTDRVTRGYLAWLMWGGDAGRDWATRERAGIGAAREDGSR